MTTTADWVGDTLYHLGGNTLQPDNRVDTAMNTSVTSILFKYVLKGITAGTIIAVDLEEIRIWETDNNKTATVVERAVNGTTAAAHSTLASVYSKPKFTPSRIIRALNHDLDDLSSPENGLFQVKIVPEFTYAAGTNAYDLTGITAEDDVIAVDYKAPGNSAVWVPLPPEQWRVARDQNTTSFPSGFSISFPYGGVSGQTYRVRYRTGFVALSTTSLTTDVATTFLPTSAYDLPPLGAALELMAGREVKRNFIEAQGDTRRAAEVPSGATLQSVNGLIRQRQRRINAEASRLSSRYPLMLRTWA